MKFGHIDSDAKNNKIISDMDKNSDNAIELNELLEHQFEEHTGTPTSGSCPVNMHMASGVCVANTNTNGDATTPATGDNTSTSGGSTTTVPATGDATT